MTRLLGELRALDRAYTPGRHGRWSATRRAEHVDRCLAELFAAGEAPAGTALAAVGGYGRGELAPGSDIDLLILHPGREPMHAIAAVAERILYPLWDAGLIVGHAVRTPDECEAAARERLDVLASMLDLRALAGDVALVDVALGRVVGLARADPHGFVRGLRADAERRRERYGSVSHLLEPELKDGAGGLRDVHAVRWAALAATGDASLGALQANGDLGPDERSALEAAEEFLTRVRSALHLETGRATNRLPLDLQPAIATAMGFADEPQWPAVDGLMRSTFEHARRIEHLSRAITDRLLGDEKQDQPVALAELASAVEPGAPWTDELRGAFLDSLRSGEGVRALGFLDRAGLLSRILPEWAEVRCRPQRDPYHRFTVDVHLLETLAGMSRLLAGDTPEGDPVASEAIAAVRDPDALLLGALFHDIGKTGRGRHVEVGAVMARTALDRMALERPTSELATFLVEEHLLLSDTATRRDLRDADLVTDVAARIATPERLAALYLLAVADAVATGPHAWTPWRATLVRELVGKVERILERGDLEGEAAERLDRRAAAIRHALAGEPTDDVERFLARLPRGYVLGVSPEQAAAHFTLVAPPIGGVEVRTAAGIGTREDTYALVVVAADRPGLLSWIAGALSLAGLSILSAQVFTTDDGVAVDLFDVVGAFEPEVKEERWREFRSTLRHVLEGRVSLERRVSEKRKSYPAPRADLPVEITIDNDASDFFTVIEVGAPDRIGLLFDITRTLAELRLDVHLAKVATYGQRVIDVFYVRDAVGRKIVDRDDVGEIERALAARLSG